MNELHIILGSYCANHVAYTYSMRMAKRICRMLNAAWKNGKFENSAQQRKHAKIADMSVAPARHVAALRHAGDL